MAKQKIEIADAGDSGSDGEGGSSAHCEDLRVEANDLTADTRSIRNSSMLNWRSSIRQPSTTLQTKTIFIHRKSPPGKRSPRCGAAPRIAKNEIAATDADSRGDGEIPSTHCEDLRADANDLTADTRSITRNSLILSRRSSIRQPSTTLQTKTILIYTKSSPGRSRCCTAPRIVKEKLKIADADGASGGDGEGSSAHCEDLRAEADDLTADTSSISNSSSLSRMTSISFGSVSVHTHPVTLGDNPAVSTGLPVTLDWEAVNSECFDVDEYETMCKGRGHKSQQIHSADREAWLREKGYTRECFEKVCREIRAIKRSRRQSNANPTKELGEPKCFKRVPREINEIEASRRQFRGKSASNADPKKELGESKKELGSMEEYLLLANATRRPGCRVASTVHNSQGAEKKSSLGGSKVLQRFKSNRLLV
jgi:hypothetical protein